MKINNIEITEEQQHEMTRFLGIRPEIKYEYVPVVFRTLPVEARPRIKLTVLPSTEKARYADEMGSGTGSNYGTMVVDICKRGIVGIENYPDIEGNTIKWEGVQTVDCISHNILFEVANVILENQSLNDDERLGLK